MQVKRVLRAEQKRLKDAKATGSVGCGLNRMCCLVSKWCPVLPRAICCVCCKCNPIVLQLWAELSCPCLVQWYIRFYCRNCSVSWSHPSFLVPHPSRLRLTLVCCQLLWLQQQWELLLFLSSSCCSTSFFSLFDCLCVVCALLFALFNSLLVAFSQLLFTYSLSFFWQFLPFISLSVVISLCKSDLAVPLARCDLWPCVYIYRYIYSIFLLISFSLFFPYCRKLISVNYDGQFCCFLFGRKVFPRNVLARKSTMAKCWFSCHGELAIFNSLRELLFVFNGFDFRFIRMCCLPINWFSFKGFTLIMK